MRNPLMLLPLAVALAAGCSQEAAAPAAAPTAEKAPAGPLTPLHLPPQPPRGDPLARRHGTETRKRRHTYTL
ncbi:hypothetical protein EKL94_18275, partial [Stenotrophomonas maltophilia]